MSPKPIEFPVDGLSDGVVHLRLIAEADIPAIVDAVQDPEIPRWTRVPDPYGEEDGRHFHRMATTGREAGTDLATVIVDADDGHLLGTIALHNIDPENGRCTGGYWIAAPEKRSALSQAKMQLLQQLLAAELNASAFGSAPNSGSFASWEAAFCGANSNAIKNAQQQAASFNSQGDSQTFTPGTSADSKFARFIAKLRTGTTGPNEPDAERR